MCLIVFYSYNLTVSEAVREKLARICVESIKMAKENIWIGSAHNVHVERQEGGNLEDSRFLAGLILRKTYLRGNMRERKL